MSDVRIGVIGGSGLYEMAGLKVAEERKIETPWGAPSDAFIVGELDGRKVVFLARHGRGHRLLPTELNFRANIYGFKQLGVEFLISVSAVGSLKEEYVPGHIVVPDQFYDRTRHRPDTFFGNGIGENGRQRLRDRIGDRDMGDDAVAEESVRPVAYIRPG